MYNIKNNNRDNVVGDTSAERKCSSCRKEAVKFIFWARNLNNYSCFKGDVFTAI